MIEKLFGKKSTGYTYLTAACFIIFFLLLKVGEFFFYRDSTPMRILGTVVTCAISLAIITAPFVIQKIFKVFFPPSLTNMLCIFVMIYCSAGLRDFNRTDIAEVATAVLSGSIIAFTIFSVTYSGYTARCAKKEKKFNKYINSFITIFLSGLVFFIWHSIEYIIEIIFFDTPPEKFTPFMIEAGYNMVGGILLGIITSFLVNYKRTDYLRMRSFKNTEEAKAKALSENHTSFYQVIESQEKDTTDYKNVARWVKAKYFASKIIYFGFYVAYFSILLFQYFTYKNLSISLIISAAITAILNGIIYIYEYSLFKRKMQKKKRLRILKLVKSTMRIVVLALNIAILIMADYNYNEFTVFISFVMIVINIVTFITNIYGTIKKDARINQIEIKKERLQQESLQPNLECSDDFNDLECMDTIDDLDDDSIDDNTTNESFDSSITVNNDFDILEELEKLEDLIDDDNKELAEKE